MVIKFLPVQFTSMTSVRQCSLCGALVPEFQTNDGTAQHRKWHKREDDRIRDLLRRETTVAI